MKKLLRGQMLVELLLTIGLLAIIFPAILTGLIASREGKPQQIQRSQATTLLKETEQAVRSIKDMGWSNIATFSATPLHPVISGSHWALAPGSETTNDLTRQVVISDVFRNNNNQIVDTGGTLDPSTKKITITVSWTTPRNSNLNSIMYFTRSNNQTKTQTTQSDFNAGNPNDVTIESTTGTSIPDNGQIKLATGSGDWCNPSAYLVNKLTLPKPGRTIAAFPGNAMGQPDSAYIGIGNGTSGTYFTNVSISDQHPPVPAILGSTSSTNAITTNAVFANNNYAFLATNENTNQIKIIRLSDNTLFKTINIGSNKPAYGIYVVDEALYVTSDKNIYVYNISNMNNILLLSSKTIWCGAFGILCNSSTTTRQIIATDTKVYVTISNSLVGLQVYTIEPGGDLAKWSNGQIDWGLSGWAWNQQAQGLEVNSTDSRAYVAFNSTTQPNGFYIINTSSRSCPWWLGGECLSSHTGTDYNANNLTPSGMTLATPDIALLVGTGGTEQYQVISNLTTDNPTHCGGMSVTNGAKGVAAVSQQDTDVYSYIISGNTQDQFMVVEGGAGGGSSTIGTFESATIDTGSSSVFNSFIANITQPQNTSIKMQIAVAQAPPPGTNCNDATYTYLGPNGSTSDYFTANGSSISAQIPFGNYVPSYSNPARCFRYKTTLSTTNPNTSPKFYDMTVNYSP